MVGQWSEKQIQRAKTRGAILFFAPAYPDDKKGDHLKAQVETKVGPLAPGVWAYWLVVLIRDRALIRRPGGRVCRPRTAADLIRHVAPWTPRRGVTGRKRVQPENPGLYGPLARQANEALKLQLKNYRHCENNP